VSRLFAFAVALLLPVAGAAQNYPSKPLRLICPFPPAGAVDIASRATAYELSRILGHPVNVENKPGAGGNLGGAEAARSAPDGYTLFMTTSGIQAINPALYAKMPFDPNRDLAPVAALVSLNNVLVVHPSVPAKTVQEVIALAKKDPGKWTYASSGNGTSIHLSGELLKYYGKFDAVHVPFRGAPAAMAALLAGDVDFMFDALSISAPQIRAGKIRLLAVTSRERSTMFPEAPTLIESGFPEFEVSGWTGIMVTGGTPQPVIARLEAELRKILSDRELITAFEKPGMTVSFAGARDFARFLDEEIKRWAVAVKHSGAQAD